LLSTSDADGFTFAFGAVGFLEVDEEDALFLDGVDDDDDDEGNGELEPDDDDEDFLDAFVDKEDDDDADDDDDDDDDDELDAFVDNEDDNDVDDDEAAACPLSSFEPLESLIFKLASWLRQSFPSVSCLIANRTPPDFFV